jgi:hypothetical protein
MTDGVEVVVVVGDDSFSLLLSLSHYSFIHSSIHYNFIVILTNSKSEFMSEVIVRFTVTVYKQRRQQQHQQNHNSSRLYPLPVGFSTKINEL